MTCLIKFRGDNIARHRQKSKKSTVHPNLSIIPLKISLSQKKKQKKKNRSADTLPGPKKVHANISLKHLPGYHSEPKLLSCFLCLNQAPLKQWHFWRSQTVYKQMLGFFFKCRNKCVDPRLGTENIFLRSNRHAFIC